MINHKENAVWAMFSKFIRARDADERGYCRCISCNTIKNWKEMDAGHYQSVGSDRALKYNEVNVNSQCTSCNQFKSGNLIEYRRGLVNKYGEKIVKDLETSHYFKTTKKKPSQGELNAMYNYYRDEFNKLCKIKCI